MTDTSTADGSDRTYYPPPAPSPLQLISQSAPAQPQEADQKIQDRLPGGNVPWTTRPTQGFSSGPPQPPPPTPAPRPPEAPVATAPVTPPKPPPENQRFTPHQTPRPMSEIGKPTSAIAGLPHYPGLEFTTVLPSRDEAPGVIRGAGKQMAMFGPPSVAGPAKVASDIAGIIGPFLDFYSKNAFSSHYRSTMLGETQQQEAQVRMQEARMRMQSEQMQLLHQQMLENGAQAIANSSLIMSKYSDIFNKHDAGTIDDAAYHEALDNLNQETGHSTFGVLLANKGPGAVRQQLLEDDAKLRDFWSAYAVLDYADKTKKKQTGDQSDDWTDGSGSSARDALFKGQAEETREASADQTKAPTPDDAKSTLKKIQKDNGLNDQGMNAAQDIVEQGDVPGMTKAEGPKLHPLKYHAAATAAGQIGHEIGQIASGAGTPEEKIEAIRNINPNVAQTLDDLANYRQELKDVPNATRGQFSSWAHQVNPKYDPTKAAQLKEFYKAGSKENTAMQAAANLPNVMIQLYSNLRKQENTNYFGTKLDQALKGLSQDPEYNLIANQLRVVQQAITAIQSGTGVPRVTILEEMMKAVPATASSETIRGAMMQDLAEAWGRVGNIQGQFSNFGVKGYAPGLNKETVDLYSGFLRSNWRSGEFPSDVPPQLKQLSRDPAKARTGLSKTEREPPPTEAEARGARIFYQRNKDNPDPAIQAQIQHAMRTMGLTPNPPWELHVNE